MWLAIQTSPVQNWLVKYSAEKLSEKLGTKVEVKHIKISFLNSADIEGVLVKDKKKDTLLYAAQLKVRITDWFIFKDKAELKFIGLEDAVVKLNRTDSVWNYQFIADFFASPKKSSSKKQGLVVGLKKIDFKNIRFINDDRWRGERIEVTLGSCIVNADEVNFDKNIFKIENVLIEKPFVNIQNFDGLRPKIKNTKMSIDTGYGLNPARMYLQIASLNINNGSFIDDGNQRNPSSNFDASHLFFSKINGNFKNVLLHNDTLTTNMDLSCKERSGFEVKKLAANFRVHPKIMEFANLDLQTNKSQLSNYYAMKFNHFNDDFSDYENKVTMVAKFAKATIHSDDIAFFAPAIKKLKRQVALSGNFNGTVENFTINQLIAKSSNTVIEGNLMMKGLPDFDKTIITLNNGTIQTNKSDLLLVAPELNNFTNPDIAALGNILFRGSFNGLYNNFKTTGNISTNLGGVYADLSMQFPNIGEPTYTGVLNTSRFNLGKFINNNQLGIIDVKGKIAGRSFNLANMKTSFDGTINQIYFNEYNYTNITTLGTFEKNAFFGQLKINDPNIDLIGTVQVDFTEEQPRFNLFADILKSNYQQLKLTKDDLKITGTLDVNFTGTNIDNFAGDAKLLNAVVKNNDAEIKFDSLSLASNYLNGVKTLKLSSADFTSTIVGDFSILNLPKSFQSFLHKYYPAYVTEATMVQKNQNFTFNITTNNIEPYLKLLDKKIAGFNNAQISGNLNTNESNLLININIPSFNYDTYAFTGIDLTGKGNLDSLLLVGDITSTKISDSLNLPFTKLKISSANDHSIVDIKTRANNTLNDAFLVADVFTLEDGVRVNFRPSSFVVNDKKWEIEKEGEIVARKGFLSANNLKLTQGYQQIIVDTENEEDNNATHLNIDFKNVLLGDFVSYAIKDPKIQGVATGSMKLKDFFGNFSAEANLNVEQFRLDEDSIGIAKVIANYNEKTGKITWNWDSPNEKFRFTAKGYYETKDTTNTTTLNTDIVLSNTRITLIQKYLKGIFSDVDGLATGTLKVTEKKGVINLLGNVSLRDAGLLVDYTQVYYNIDSAFIKFEDDGIDFGNFTIKDKKKNTGTVKGKLYEKGFNNMFFDFDLTTPKLLLLDTKPKDNQQFYGNATGKASLSFKGPENNAKMIIVGEANDSSHIFIPNSSNKESSEADFIVFKQFGEEMTPEGKKNGFNLSVDLDLAANNKVEIDVILDDLAGDVIKANGNGRLRIKAGSNEKLDIRGRYNIDNGKYDFNFQSFIKKPFFLLPGSGNYIEWTGDAMKADLHIDAQYEAENVSLSELTSNTSLNSNQNNNLRDKVYVIAQLRDKLTQPTIKFKIDFPPNSPAKNDAELSQFIARIEKDDNEMITQATSLIVFNSFVPYGKNLTGGINYTGLGINTISQKVFAELNKQVSSFLFNLFKDKSLKLDLGTSVYSSGNLFNDGVNATNNSRIDRSRFNFKIGRSFFNNNIVVTFGGDLDFSWGASAAQSGNFQWLPDLNIEIVLSKDKKLRAIVFNKNSLDISGGNALGRRNRQGVSISYRQEFELLFGKKEEDILIAPPIKIEAELPKPLTVPPPVSNTNGG